MTSGVFKSQMARLNTLRFAPATLASHWDALQDIPDELFTAAVSLALRTRAEFPAPAELRADTDAVVRRQTPLAVPPTSFRVPVDGELKATIRNPFTDDRSKDIVVTITETIPHCCDDCDDTGWASYWCGSGPSTMAPWLYRRRCDRQHPPSHPGHDWADVCPCAATNPAILRRKAAQAVRYASEPEKVGR